MPERSGSHKGLNQFITLAENTEAEIDEFDSGTIDQNILRLDIPVSNFVSL